MTFDQPSLDLSAYFDRIGYTGETRPTLATLRALHLAHATTIPFENLDILLGRSIGIDLERVQAKLVRARRGGYCFEQNTLFAAVLEQIGFSVTRLAARVRWGTQRVLPRTHMLLKVEAEGESWLADVGFGGWGLLHPVPLVPEQVSVQFAWPYRLLRDGELWLLQAFHPAPDRRVWQDMYAFTLEPNYPVDFEPANHYVATHPDSRFVQTRLVALPSPEKRFVLKNNEWVVIHPEGETSRIIAEEDVPGLLATSFGLVFSPDVRFPYPAQSRASENLI